jgi:5'-3' exonuclease
MNVHLVDGTYELFRHYFAVPPGQDVNGLEIGAVRGVLASVLGMIQAGATHIGVATDHVIESFRNDLYAGYKTADGVPETLLAQFPVLEDALQSMGVMVWPMVRYEADDALASAAAKAGRDPRVLQVLICTPDKDLAQCVVERRIVQFDRRRGIVRDEAGVVAKWGVRPESIPDYLAVVGDTADGFPGLPGWGAKAAALTLSRFAHLEHIPKDWRHWDPSIRGAQRLSAVLFEQWENALLYRDLATLRLDVPVFESVDDLKWSGPGPGFDKFCERLQSPALFARTVAAMENGSVGAVPAVSGRG